MQTLDALSRKFAVPNVVRFEPGSGGLTRIVVTTPAAEAHVYLHGAHVAHYARSGEKPIIWMSGSSWFEDGKPIRGGVPVCFPWFGPRAGRPDSPNHGFARLREWEVESVTPQADGSVTTVLKLASDDNTCAHWPHDFVIRHRVRVGRTLAMTLEVTNTGREALTFEEALHTYFAVGDIRGVTVRGLENAEYLSKVEGGKKRQGAAPIAFEGETDRVYLNARGPCTIEDPSFARRIAIEKAGSDATVVWNPWSAKAKAMPDFGDDEWPGMVCVETCNVMENAVTLEPGKTHAMSAEIK